MAWETTSRYFSGQGVVLVGNAAEGYIEVGNVAELKINISTQVKEHKESQSGQRGIDARLTTEVKAAMSMQLESFSRENLALALRGSSSAVSAGTATAFAVKAVMGRIVALPHLKVSAVVVKKGATTIPDTEYKLNAAAGSIKFNATSTDYAAGDDLTVAYSYGAQEKVEAMTAAPSEVMVRFEGLNTAEDNKPVVVEVHRFLTDPLKELSLIGEDIAKFMLEGNILADMSKGEGDSKYFRQLMA